MTPGPRAGAGRSGAAGGPLPLGSPAPVGTVTPCTNPTSAPPDTSRSLRRRTSPPTATPPCRPLRAQREQQARRQILGGRHTRRHPQPQVPTMPQRPRARIERFRHLHDPPRPGRNQLPHDREPHGKRSPRTTPSCRPSATVSSSVLAHTHPVQRQQTHARGAAWAPPPASASRGPSVTPYSRPGAGPQGTGHSPRGLAASPRKRAPPSDNTPSARGAAGRPRDGRPRRSTTALVTGLSVSHRHASPARTGPTGHPSPSRPTAPLSRGRTPHRTPTGTEPSASSPPRHRRRQTGPPPRPAERHASAGGGPRRPGAPPRSGRGAAGRAGYRRPVPCSPGRSGPGRAPRSPCRLPATWRPARLPTC